MKDDLEILLAKYGNKRKLADKLEISQRHLDNILKDEKMAGAALKALVRIYARQIRELE
jgi:DNA-binding Xre family transcriptional regulator